MQRMTLLITAFQPLADHINSSERLWTALREEPWTKSSPTCFELLANDSLLLKGQIERMLQSYRPESMVMLGQAVGNSNIRLERYARNIKNFGIPDAAGNQPRN